MTRWARLACFRRISVVQLPAQRPLVRKQNYTSQHQLCTRGYSELALELLNIGKWQEKDQKNMLMDETSKETEKGNRSWCLAGNQSCIFLYQASRLRCGNARGVFLPFTSQ